MFDRLASSDRSRVAKVFKGFATVVGYVGARQAILALSRQLGANLDQMASLRRHDRGNS